MALVNGKRKLIAICQMMCQKLGLVMYAGGVNE